MWKHVLAPTMLTAGMLFAGTAFAQSRPAVTPSPRAIGDVYTSALNDLYSRGFHGARDLSRQGWLVDAKVFTPHGMPRTVSVNPGTGQISQS